MGNRAAKGPSPAGEAFADKFKELGDNDWCHIPLDELMDLIGECGDAAVCEGMKNNPWILHQLLALFQTEYESEEAFCEVIETLLDICPEVAGIPVPANETFSNFDPEVPVYPLLAACYNHETPNGVIESLLKRSTKGLDQMVVIGDGIVEWCHTEVAGVPLHYYLYWGKGDIAIVKRLVDAYPDALTMKDTSTLCLTPLNTVLRPPSTPDLEVVKCLVQSNRSVLRMRDFGCYPIHLALRNEYITVEVLEYLLECYPDVHELRDYEGLSPLHQLLRHDDIKESLAMDILQLFLRVAPKPTFFQEADAWGSMPMHHAASAGHGKNFCKLLMELAPGCERIRDATGALPIHGASHIETVKLLVGLYPESIYVESINMTPFAYAVRRLNRGHRDQIVRYFLELDPSFASQAVRTERGGRSVNLLPLHVACAAWWDDERLYNRAEVVKILFDYHPRAILVSGPDGKLPVDLAKDALVREKGQRLRNVAPYEENISFLETQQTFVANAINSDALNTPDKNGLILLHRALLQKDISLGTIKLIADGTSEESVSCGLNPLQLACTNSSPDIIHYLLNDYGSLANSVDEEGNNLLHLACKGGNCKAVKYLLEHHAPFAYETNDLNLLPIHLLCDGSGKEDLLDHCSCKGYFHKSAARAKEYVETIWQLLLTYPAAAATAAVDNSVLDVLRDDSE